MGKIKHRIALILIAACFAFAALIVAVAPVRAFADTGSDVQNQLNEKLVVRYSMDGVEDGKLLAEKWDSSTKSFVSNSSADATVQYNVNGSYTGTVTQVDGIENGSALSFTGKAHARASFKLPSSATGMTVSVWVKNITTYWGSLFEFWGSNSIPLIGTNYYGGRFGKGTMQGNGGRTNESDPWSSNCSAHKFARIAEGGGWDSCVVTHNNTDGNNGGAAVDNMESDTWYQVTFTLTASEMRVYRNGELKQTFVDGVATPGNYEAAPSTILQSIMNAAKCSNGQLGIRLSHDTTDSRADILDDVRIYNGALSAAEVKTMYDYVGDLVKAMPQYYDVEGLGYPENLLIGNAASVTDEAGGVKTGVTESGVTYTYTPLSASTATTYENDEKGIRLNLSKNGVTIATTVKFRRKLTVKAESLEYKIGSGEAVALGVPENASEDIIVKVPANTNLTNVTAGNLSVEKFAEDGNAEHYSTQFTYSASTQTATVRYSYADYAIFDTFYTVKFVKKSTDTFTAMSVTNGKNALTLTKEDFTDNSVNVGVNDLDDFTLNVSLSLAEGATVAGGTTKTFTASNLTDGKLALTVDNENGDSIVYYLVPVACSSDATLSALSAGSYGLNFAAGTTEYTVTVDKGEGAAVYAALTATANDTKATVKKVYDKTENVITVTVTAEDGSVQNYVIEINERDTDATLSEIKVGGTAIEGFDPDKSDYTVKYTGDLPTVTATAASATAEEPSVGTTDPNGKVTITVTAENGATKEYTVTLVAKSSDAELKKLTLNGTEITFENNAAEYLAPASTRLNGIVVIAETADGARVSHRVEAEENQIIVTVTAEDGTTTATYTVDVSIQSASITEGGVTEDNSPASSGCNSSVGGTAIAAAALVLAAGVWLFVKKERKSR